MLFTSSFITPAETELLACLLSSRSPCYDIVIILSCLSTLSVNPTVFRRAFVSISPSIIMLVLSWEPFRPYFKVFCLSNWSFRVFYPVIISNIGMLLKSSLVFVIERPGKWPLARAYEVTKVPPITSLSLFDGDSNSDLNLITLSSRSFTCKSVDNSKSCCFCRSICSSLCSFYSSSSF